VYVGVRGLPKDTAFSNVTTEDEMDTRDLEESAASIFEGLNVTKDVTKGVRVANRMHPTDYSKEHVQ
jgi:hypothetical protein